MIYSDNKMDPESGIAIIGMSCRFPGAKNIDEFWNNLRQGVESITHFTDEDLMKNGWTQKEKLRDSGFVKSGFILDDIDAFDASFFEYSPTEARLMDPQHRIFLECAWEALEDSGYPPDSSTGSVGVFAGARMSTYQSGFKGRRHDGGIASVFRNLVSSDKDYLTSRVSYKLNLKGPSITVQSACSTSLVAVHLACENLLSGSCDTALAGGAAIMVPQKTGYHYQKGMIFSPDGRCRPFDSKADGMVGGNGVGIVVLKRLDDALASGDRIIAVIRGSAVNNDGSLKMGYTAPSVEGQSEVIKEAIAVADVPAESISYIETHGTGTALGDPVEIAALTRVFRTETDKKGFCAVGSVKSNVGHLDTAAGVAGLIKTALSIQNREIPPSLNFDRPNPQIDFDSSPFFVNTQLSEWKRSHYPRRAGVSSFGFGGTNAHVILEQAPETDAPESGSQKRPHILALSAKRQEGLASLIGSYRNFLSNGSKKTITDICYTANAGRSHFPYRAAFIADSLEDFKKQIEKRLQGENCRIQLADTSVIGADPCSKMVFLFSGSVPRISGAVRELYEALPVFKSGLDQCDQLLRERGSRSVVSELLEDDETAGLTGRNTCSRAALFAFQYAFSSMLRFWGISPAAVMGEGIGEISAAFFSGVITLEDGLYLAASKDAGIDRVTGFDQAVASMNFEKPKIALLSGGSGSTLSDQDACSHEYWKKRINGSGQPKGGIETAWASGFEIFFEIGTADGSLFPDQMEGFQKDESRLRLTSFMEGKDGFTHVLETLGELYIRGAEVRWNRFYTGNEANRVRLPTYPFEKTRFWMERKTEESAVRQEQPDHMPGRLWDAVTQYGKNASESGISRLGLGEYEKNEPVMKRLFASYISRAFEQIGLFTEKDKIQSVDDILTFFPILPKYRQLLPRLLNGLAQAGLIEKDGDGYKNLTSADTEGIEGAVNTLGAMKMFVGNPASLDFIIKSGENLGNVLTGKQDPMEVLFPAGSFELVEEMYRNAPQSRYYNNIVKDILAGVCAALPEDTHFSILEIGAGTGSTTASLLNVLPPGRVAYTFTDLSPIFLKRAEEKFKDYPFLETEILDIHEDPRQQGMKDRQFDIVIASNVLHAARDLQAAVEHVRSLLAPGGLLLIREITRPMPLFDISFGPMLTELTDDSLRGGSPFISVDKWEALLKLNNFASFASFPRKGAPAEILDEHIITARLADTLEDDAPPAFSPGLPKARTENILMSSWEPLPLVGTRIDSPVKEHVQFVSRIGISEYPYIADHEIHGNILLPGTFFVMMALKGAEALSGKKYFTLHDVAFENILVFPEDGRAVTLHTVFSEPDSESGEDSKKFRIFSAAPSRSDGWMRHVSGALSDEKPCKPARPELLAEIRKRCSREIGIDTYCRQTRERGFTYGSAFQGIRSLYSDDGPEAVGEIVLVSSLKGSRSDQLMHPAMLDACLQLTGAVIPADILDDPKTSFIDVGVEKVRFYREAPETVWCHARLREGDAREEKQLSADFTIMDPSGNLVGDIRGFLIKVSFGEGVKAVEPETNPADDFYTVAWRRQPGTAPAPRPEEKEPGIWMIFGDAEGAGLSLARRFMERGEHCVMISPGETFTYADRTGMPCCTVNPLSPGDFKDLLMHIGQSAGDDGRHRNMVYMWSMDEETAAPHEGAQRICAGVLHLVQAVTGMKRQAPQRFQSRLWMVTKGAQKVLDSDSRLNPAQAALWGLNNVIASEHPELTGVVVDLDASDPAARADALFGELSESGKENQVAFRGGGRYVPRFTKLDAAVTQVCEEPDLPAGTYLITGGLGGLGIALSGWMAEKGVRHLALIGRHGPSAAAADAIESMRADGVEIHLYQADVSVWEEIKTVFEEIHRTMPPVKGVFHLAGVLDDAALADQDRRGFEKVMRPKAAGAWHLHRLTASMELQHFVLFSSAASMFGTHGQGNHAAASAFLDGLAFCMRSRGRKAVCLNWGVWSETGSAVDSRLQERLTRNGVPPLTVKQGLALFEYALLHDFTRAAVISIDWPAYCGIFQEDGMPPFFSEFSNRNETANDADGVNKSSDILNFLQKEGDPKLRLDRVKSYLKQKIAETLQMDAELIEDDSDLIQLGMDSLIFIDLSGILSKDLGIQIVPHEVFENPKATAMAELFLKGITAAPDGNEAVTEDIGENEFVAIIDKENTHKPFELMDMQQAYLVGQSGAVELGNVSCHVYTEVESDVIDIDRYEAAWRQLIDRHGMLRAIFLPSGKQKILSEVPAYRIKVGDFRGLPPDERESRLTAVRRRMSHQILDAGKWPLFEVRASRLEKNRVRLHLSIDLLIADVHSIILMMQELMAFYRHPGRELEPLDITFRDYVLSERAFKHSQLYMTSREYWLNRLGTLPRAPEFPTVEKAGDGGTPTFVRRTFTLPAEKWSALKKRASNHGLTPSLCLLAVYAKIISKWSANPRFTVNITLFNRMPVHSQVNKIVGDFTSVLLLAVDDTDEASFAATAGRIRNRFWEDMKHRYFSGIEVLRILAKKNAVSIMPVVFTSQLGYGGIDRLTPEKEFPGEVIYGITQTPQVWLDNQSREENGELTVFWDSVDAIFPQGFLDGMFDAYCRLIEALASGTEAWEAPRVPDLLPPDQKETRRIANDTAGPVSGDLLHTPFLRQAQDRPDHPAVVTSSRVLTNRELMSYSGHVAGLLLNEKVGPEELVAVFMEKGWEQAAAVLGILRAGAAYLPIDPALPEDRIAYLLNSSNASLVLSQSWVMSRGILPDHARCFPIDTLTPADEDGPLLNAVCGPDSLAYVIYTSGTTGLPKGVMIDHKGAVNTVLDINGRCSVGPGDKVLALSSLSFDLSVYDIFGTLAAGGTIVMPDADKAREPSHWEALVRREGVTLWNSVPQMMQMFLDYTAGRQDDALLNRLRLVLLSGDWIPSALPGQLRRMAEEVRIVSLGGATEASIWSVFHDIHEVDGSWKSIPYGRPLQNQSCHVLDGHMADCPDWVPGSLYIGGAGLAKGYLNDEKKTAWSFIRHPGTGARLYRTGDRARYLPDGTLEFLGREDSQIKIRGYRVEPGEIEATLKQMPEIEKAVVVAVGSEKRERRLAAYLVADSENKAGLMEETAARNPDAAASCWAGMLSAGKKESAAIPPNIDINYFKAYMDSLKRLSRAAICRTVSKLGMFQETGKQRTVSEVTEEYRIVKKYHKLVRQWLNVLVEDGFLEKETLADTYRCIRPLVYGNMEELWRNVEYFANWGGKKSHLAVSYLKKSVNNHAALLTGEVNPLELFFAEGSQETAESIYRFNPGAEYHNAVAREIIKSAAARSSGKQKLKILEVGAGTGSITSALLPVLDKEKTVYTFTDLSSYFISDAKKKFADYPFVEYGMLDIDKNPLHQGYEACHYDIAVAHNVLHDAKNIDKSLAFLKSVLSPGGFIVIVEGTENNSLQMVSVAFLEGFSRFEDERVKDNLPLLTADQWERTVYRNGFEDFAAFPEKGHPAEAFMQHTMIIRSGSVQHRLSADLPDRYLKRKLPAYMIPSAYLFIDDIPLTENGKIDRKALPEIQESRGFQSGAEASPAQTPVEAFLVETLSGIFETGGIGIGDNFFDLGGDSLIAVQLIAMIRDRFKTELSLQRIYEHPEIRQLAGVIQESRGKDGGRSLVDMSPGSEGKPVFFIHQGSGQVVVYNDLVKKLSAAGIKSYGLQSRGLRTGAAFDESIEEMARAYIEEIRAVQSEGAYTLCGYCMGGYVAFEIAKRMTAAGDEVDRLILVNSQPLEKDFCKDRRNLFRLYMTMFFQDDVMARMEEDASEEIAEKSLDDIIAAVFEKGASAGVIPANMMFNEFKRLAAVLNSNVAAMCQYGLEVSPVDVTLFKAEDQFAYYSDRPDFVDMWKSAAGRTFDVEEIPGSHFSCLKEPNVAVLAEKMNKILKPENV